MTMRIRIDIATAISILLLLGGKTAFAINGPFAWEQEICNAKGIVEVEVQLDGPDQVGPEVVIREVLMPSTLSGVTLGPDAKVDWQEVAMRRIEIEYRLRELRKKPRGKRRGTWPAAMAARPRRPFVGPSFGSAMRYSAFRLPGAVSGFVFLSHCSSSFTITTRPRKSVA